MVVYCNKEEGRRKRKKIWQAREGGAYIWQWQCVCVLDSHALPCACFLPPIDWTLQQACHLTALGRLRLACLELA